MPPTGIEPVRYLYLVILSHLRMPVSPRRQIVFILQQQGVNVNAD